MAVRDRHEASQVRDTMQLRAHRIIEEELTERGLGYQDLAHIPKGGAIKIQIARKLRRSTTLTLKDIAALLHAGAWRSLANALSAHVSI